MYSFYYGWVWNGMCVKHCCDRWCICVKCCQRKIVSFLLHTHRKQSHRHLKPHHMKVNLCSHGLRWDERHRAETGTTAHRVCVNAEVISNSSFFSENENKSCTDQKRGARNLKHCFWRYLTNSQFSLLNQYVFRKDYDMQIFWCCLVKSTSCGGYPTNPGVQAQSSSANLQNSSPLCRTVLHPQCPVQRQAAVGCRSAQTEKRHSPLSSHGPSTLAPSGPLGANRRPFFLSGHGQSVLRNGPHSEPEGQTQRGEERPGHSEPQSAWQGWKLCQQ